MGCGGGAVNGIMPLSTLVDATAMSSAGHTYEYTVLLHPDEEEGGFTVTVPALPGIVTEGDTLEEALEMVRDAIALYLEDLTADGEAIPTETTPPQLARVR